jgi:hypothetical protein
MIGLLATYYVVAYLLVPSALFRALYSLVLPPTIKFQRTKAEEFTFAAMASALPFFVALFFVWTCASWPFPVAGDSASDRRNEYHTVIGAAITEKAYGEGPQAQVFWHAANKVIRRQARFLFWYYALVLLEAWLLAWLTTNYGKWTTRLKGRRKKTYSWLANKILLPTVSQWYVLLTPFSYPPEPKREVWVDVLSTLDVLYTGHVVNFFLDKDGELSGIFLEHPRRFDRPRYHEDVARGKAKDTNSYWKRIPSNNLYIPNEKIVNLNVRYRTEAEVTALRATWLLLDEGLDVQAFYSEKAQTAF